MKKIDIWESLFEFLNLESVYERKRFDDIHKSVAHFLSENQCETFVLIFATAYLENLLETQNFKLKLSHSPYTGDVQIVILTEDENLGLSLRLKGYTVKNPFDFNY